MNDLVCLWIGRVVFYTLGVIFIALWCGFSIKTTKHLYYFIRWVRLDPKKCVGWGRWKKIWWMVKVYSIVIWDQFEYSFLLGPNVDYKKEIVNGKVQINRSR